MEFCITVLLAETWGKMADVIAFMILVYCYNFCQPESENMICKLIKVFFII
jgi:hypothetical protein